MLLAVPAAADDRVSVGTSLAIDTDGLTVVQPAVSARVEVVEDVHVSGRYEADVISAATVDVRTSASVRPFEETRHGGALGLELELDRLTTLSGTGSFSYSPDYASGGLSLRLRVEDDARRHALTVDVGGAYDSVGRVGDASPTGDAFAAATALAWSIVLSPQAVVDFALAIDHRRGFLESPYRFVTVAGSGSQVRLPEEVPDERWRAALGGGLRWAIAEPFYIRAGYRFHVDDWGVAGHTVDVAGHLAPAPGWLLTASGRVLSQRGATFYSGGYATLPEIPEYRTRDRTLSPHWSMVGALDLRIPIETVAGFRVSANVRGRVVWHRYFDTPLLPERTTWIASFALTAER